MNKFPKIYGFNRTSEAGIDVLAYSVFLGGCNFHCPYCMNSKLVNSLENIKLIDFKLIEEGILKEKVKWVFISGGEALLSDIDELLHLISKIKNLGCKVGISTNGSFPHKLSVVVDHVNYVALDIKCDIDGYKDGSVCRISDVFGKVMQSKSILFNEKLLRNDDNSFDYEVRTTLFPPYVKNGKFSNIGKNIGKDEKWVLQVFRPTRYMLGLKYNDVFPLTDEEIKFYFEQAKSFSDKVLLRHV